MAENEEAEASDGVEQDKPKSKRLLLFIVLALLLIGISVGGTIVALSFLKKDEPTMTPEGEVVEEEIEEVKAAAIYYPLKPGYVVNVDARGRRRFLQADLTLLLRDAAMIETIDMHKPSVDHRVNSIIGGIIFEDIKTAEGKELLRLQLTQELQNLFQEEVGEPGIEAVLFTNFVMQ